MIGFLDCILTAGSLPTLLIVVDKEAGFLGKADASCGSKSVFAFSSICILTPSQCAKHKGNFREKRRIAQSNVLSSVSPVV